MKFIYVHLIHFHACKKKNIKKKKIFQFRGGFENNCEEGYTGPLCASCQDNYGKQGLTDCTICSSKEVNTFVFIMMISILFILIIGFVLYYL